jgi:hypothetical protein
MSHIVVSDDQARIICAATGNVEIRDQHGNHLGYVAHGFTNDDIAIARRRLASEEPRYTTKEVLEHLESLEAK